jgi:DNA-binding NtrC family response regulator
MTLTTESLLFIGYSPAAETLRRDIEIAARTHAKVLILGETGAGKEVVARLIHAKSARRGYPFVAVNCSGIPETLLESELFGHLRGSFTGAYRDKIGLVRQADRGTLFLDELGEMSLRMQAMLLRFAETGEIQPIGADGIVGRTDVRLIAATNRDLSARVREGLFREDLFYRLNVLQILVPPLRERREDILVLLRYFLARASEAHRLPSPVLTTSAEQAVVEYGWPGNVRELKNVAERLVVADRGRPLTPDDLPRELRGQSAATTGHRQAMLAAVAVGNPQDVLRVGPVAPSPSEGSATETAQRLWTQLLGGGDFWEVVYKRFKAREVTRHDLANLIDMGLRHTNGSYRALLAAFNLPPGDYRRFHAFLYQQRCNLPVAPYRRGGARAMAIDRASRRQASS